VGSLKSSQTKVTVEWCSSLRFGTNAQAKLLALVKLDSAMHAVTGKPCAPVSKRTALFKASSIVTVLFDSVIQFDDGADLRRARSASGSVGAVSTQVPQRKRLAIMRCQVSGFIVKAVH
jgi:hypothetical protein